ncbi:MAG: AAA family ATPase [Muribaculaceae bacterium]|nr:AAA family ATPase [Muribaculaceae bacterium]
MEKLFEKSRIRIAEVTTDFIRDIHDEIAWDDRLVAIIGARGVGKTTLLLQHIKLYDNAATALYVSADDLWFTSHTLVELADTFYKNGGKILYIDEIHRYSNWSVELKNIYDTYSGLKVVYTGSSILDIRRGGADLSRRHLEYMMYGLSFREYLILAYGIKLPVSSLEDVLSHRVQFPVNEYRPIALFKEYMRMGYYPFFRQIDCHTRLQQVVDQILDVDIPKYAELSLTTIEKLKRLMYVISQSVPFKPNYSKLGRDLECHRTSLSDLVLLLDKTQMIQILRDDSFGVSSLGKVDKIYLGNTNLACALSDNEPEIGNLRETVFLTSVKPKYDVMSSSVSDFKIGKYTFEVGGKNKKQKQIQGVDNAYVVKDDIEYGHLNIIPLWAFGFLY